MIDNMFDSTFNKFVTKFCRGQKIPSNQIFLEDGAMRVVFTSKKALPNASKIKSMIIDCIDNYEEYNDCICEDLDIEVKRIRPFNILPMHSSVVYTCIQASVTNADTSVIHWLDLIIADHTESKLSTSMPYVVDIKSYCE